MKIKKIKTRWQLNHRGFTLLEAVIAAGVFVLFAVGIYGGLSLVFQIVYQSRIKIVETAVLSEQLEIARNLPFEQIGILNGVPTGIIPREKTVVKNGTEFTVITTVRNIDDPFDNLAPEDTAPADFKLVEVAINCANCRQNQPLTISTQIAPKKLEGDSENGSLFIHVFDSLGQGVSGADVTISNTNQTPALLVEDTTDQTGWLKVIDTPTGTYAYNITVTKSGHSSDYTITPTDVITSPTKPPATVIKQAVTELSFSIDRLGQGEIQSVSESCAVMPSVGFNLRGDKLVSTNPSVYKFDKNITTNSAGVYSLSNWEWDTYYLTPLSNSYDIAGTIPMLPLVLTPGTTQELVAVLRPHTNNSLLVKVKDAGTGLPLSDATVNILGNTTDLTRYTGLGYVRQTDWSGGEEQELIGDETKYFATDGNLSTQSQDGELTLQKNGSQYSASGWIESSTFDLGSVVEIRQIIFTPASTLPEAGLGAVQVQLAVSSSSTPDTWNYVGPDGTSATYYDALAAVVKTGTTGQYLRYRVYLSTSDTSVTPQLSELAVTYTSTCVPPGQVFFSGISSGEHTLNITRFGYAPASGVVVVDGTSETVVNMSPL